MNGFISERKDWMVGKKFSSLNRDAFELKCKKKYAYLFVSSKIIFDKCISGDLDNKHQKKQLDDMLNYLKTNTRWNSGLKMKLKKNLVKN